MVTNTDNHEYDKPQRGELDWGEILNRTLDDLDKDVEIRDTDANKSNYEPKQGAQFRATDTGAVYKGDGSSWVLQDAEFNALDIDNQTTNQSQEWGRKSVSSDGTIDGTSIYWYVDTDAAGSAVTRTLASSIAVEGRELNVKRDGAYKVVVDTEGTETIDGADSIVISTDQQSVTLVYNNTDSDWEIW